MLQNQQRYVLVSKMNKPQHYDVVVIGSGLVGAAVSCDLIASGATVAVLEAESEICAGSSRSNSGILHTGFDSTPGTLETEMILSQAGRWQFIFAELDIPYIVPGAIVLARSQEEETALERLAGNAAQQGIKIDMLTGSQLQSLEPGVPASAGLLVPAEAITDPYEVVRRLLSVGQDVSLNSKVRNLAQDRDHLLIETGNQSLLARFVINCAGLYADEIASAGEFKITPRRGEFIVYPKETASLVHHLLLPVPNKFTKGVLVFPTLYGHVCVGPTAEDQDDKTDWMPRADALRILEQKAIEVVPALRAYRPVDAWAGLRTVGHPHNYYIEFSNNFPNLLHVAGIRSTGLSACLGISQYVIKRLQERGFQPVATQLRKVATPREPLTPWWHRLNNLRQIQVAVASNVSRH